jgi:NADH dehydrogenase/NADH:ubiquinone oxidoreductase subunit G
VTAPPGADVRVGGGAASDPGAAPKLVNVTIDDEVVAIPEGTMLIEAAKGAGVTIPHFCYHERLKPIAACRLCLVEIAGMRGLQPSCATPAKDGMVVKTTTQGALESHKEVLDLVLETHPLDCPKCEAAGRCQLEDFTYEFGPHRVSNYKPPGVSGYHYEEVPWSPLLKFDPYKCVECTRCIRVCDEIHDCRALTAEGRGHRFTITTFANGPLHCDFCGSCASVCPTGAIEQQPARFLKKDWEYEKRPAICGHCAHGCTLILRTNEEVVAKVDDDVHAGINNANICSKGRFGFDIHDVESRVRTPMIRRNGQLIQAEWREAFDIAAQALEDARRGKKTAAGLASGFLSVEDLFVFREVLSGFGARALTESRDAAVSSAVAARLGVHGSTVTFDRIASWPTIAIVEADLEAADYVAEVDIVHAARNSGVSLVSIGKPGKRIERYIGKKLPLEAASVVSIEGRTLFVLDAERVPAAILEAVLERLAADPSQAGLLIVASQPNSRSLGALGFESLATDADLAADVVIVAGPVHLASRPKCATLILTASHLEGIAIEADVIFPAALPYEKPGTWVNSEGRAQGSAAAVRPQGLAWPDAAVWSRLANLAGRAIPTTPREILAAAREAAPMLGVLPAVTKSSGTKTKIELPRSRLASAEKHGTLLTRSSSWTKTMIDHLNASKEYAPWPF